jgi:hypothetical protein
MVERVVLNALREELLRRAPRAHASALGTMRSTFAAGRCLLG